jgi:hypothetical protein
MFFHARGEATYNGDGTGSFDAEWIVVDPLNERVSTWSGNCMINYVVHDRRNFTQELTCDGSLNTSTTEPPPPPVLTLERTGIIIEGVIARDGKLLLLSDTAANWEYTTITVGPTGPIVNEFRSQCGRTGTAVRARRVIHRDEED